MKKVKIHYISLPDDWRKEDKLQWFSENKMENIPFEILKPDKNANWINLAEDNDWESLMPICSKEKWMNSIFAFSSLGVSTNRDEWVYDFDKQHLIKKMRFFIDTYNKELAKKKENIVAEKGSTFNDKIEEEWNYAIKWSRDLKKKFEQKKEVFFDENLVLKANYRPFITQFWYAEKRLNDMLTQNHYDIFGEKLAQKNKVICFSGLSASKLFQTLGIADICSLDFLEKTNCLPLYRYDKEGNRTENITDWALQQFQAHYTQEGRKPSEGFRPSNTVNITKEDIFHYVYAVLHNPKYRQKYEINLKRDFPRIPFYTDFEKWVAWGKTLMDLHINYETVISYQLAVINKPIEEGQKEKPKLKAFKDSGEIQLTDYCSLTGIPAQAYQYKLGNRSAIEWVLDQYKESKPTDPTIRDKFNTYKFADYKTQVIDLLKRVCTVSMETVRIVEEMGKE